MSATPITPISSQPDTATQITDVRVLTVFRAVWLTLALIGLVLTVQSFQTLLTPTAYDAARDPKWFGQLEAWGVLQGFNIALASISLIFSLLCLSLSALLVWRGKNERVQILFAFVFVAFALAHGTGGLSQDSLFNPLSIFAGQFTTFSIFFLFPDGRFTPRWMRYIFVAALLWIAASLINSRFLTDASAPGAIGGLLFGAGSMLYRYRRADVVQRQQLKWLVVAVVLFVLGYLIYPSVFLLTDFYVQTLAKTALNLIGPALNLLIPLSIGLAILRYRLYDVDLVINRSLVYGAVTVLLVVVFAVIIGLVSILTQGQGQTIGVIVAAGAAIALFNPARRNIQNFVDHRIYRLRFNLNEVAAAQKPPEVKNPGLYTGRTFGKYEVLGVLGKGGMGEVYKGFGDNQTVAIKVLPADLAQKDEFRKRFEREAQTLASLEHPNIVKLFSSGISDDGVHYLAMEFIDGQELSDMIQQGAVQDYDNLCDWVKTVASALDYVHGKGLVHRDLKPSNIMLRPSAADKEVKEAVLMDFGIARVDTTGTRITGSGAVGTIDYMSPEQIMAAREVDKRSDIYALGIIVYELLTGERPFKGGTGQVLFAHLQQPAPDPRDVNPAVPRVMAHVVMKAMAKKADERFDSAGEFAAALL